MDVSRIINPYISSETSKGKSAEIELVSDWLSDESSSSLNAPPINDLSKISLRSWLVCAISIPSLSMEPSSVD